VANPTPDTPLKANHRFLMKLLDVTVGGKVEVLPSELDRISRVFSHMGGSWERLFRGSPEDVGLVKRIIKAAAKHGFLTKKEKWN
jgi:hypothetical protein